MLHSIPPNNLDEKDSEGNTALIRAVNDNDLILVQKLIDQGANLNIKNKKGKTALIHAGQQGKDQIAKALLDKGADPNIQDYEGRSALLHVAKASLSSQWDDFRRHDDSYRGRCHENHRKMVEALLAKGADPDISIKEDDFESNNMWDIWDEPRTAINYLHFDKSMNEILKRASNNYIGFLLSEGHTLEALPYLLSTPNTLKKLLRYAIQKNRTDIIMSIIQTHNQEKLIFLTEPSMIQTVCRYLKKDNPSLTGLAILKEIRSMNVSLSTSKELKEIDKIEKQYRVQTKIPSDILAAVNKGDFPALEENIEQHPTANLNIKDNYNRTLLDIAYTRKLSYQVAIEQKAWEGNKEDTEMAFALKKENEKIFRLLLEKSDINARTVNNQTLLHVAVTSKAPLADIVLFLVKGSDPQARDRANKRPVDYLLNKQGQLKDDDMAHAKNILEKGIDYLFEPENETILKGILQYWKDNNSFTEYNGDTALLRSIKNKVAIQQAADQWIKNNKESYQLTNYVIKLETDHNNQVDLLDQIIDSMNTKSSHNRYLEITSLQKTTLRHAIAQRIYERSCLEESNDRRIDLSHLLTEKDNMLIKWLKAPTNTGMTGGLSRLWKGSTTSFRWLQAAPTHLLSKTKKTTK